MKSFRRVFENPPGSQEQVESFNFVLQVRAAFFAYDGEMMIIGSADGTFYHIKSATMA